MWHGYTSSICPIPSNIDETVGEVVPAKQMRHRDSFSKTLNNPDMSDGRFSSAVDFTAVVEAPMTSLPGSPFQGRLGILWLQSQANE